MPRRLAYRGLSASEGEELLAAWRWPQHLPGQQCPVIALLFGVFGAPLGEYLLYEFTCFPLDDYAAYEQAEVLCLMNRAGVIDQWLTLERLCLDASMHEAAGLPWPNHEGVSV